MSEAKRTGGTRELLVAACDIAVGDVISGRTVVRSAAATGTERWVLEYSSGRCAIYYRYAKFRVRRTVGSTELENEH